jgi:zinc-finger of transposase IS204/IS1001/IS1096/IS1165
VFAVLFPDLPGFCVEQIERTEKGIRITARATASRASCPDCQQASSRVHSYYTRCPMDLPSSGRPISLALQVRHFRCLNRACPRKTVAEPLPNFLSPYAQRTSRLQESLRKLGEEIGGEAGARLSKQQGMGCSSLDRLAPARVMVPCLLLHQSKSERSPSYWRNRWPFRLHRPAVVGSAAIGHSAHTALDGLLPGIPIP